MSIPPHTKGIPLSCTPSTPAPHPATQVRVLDYFNVLAPCWDMHNKGDINHYCFSPPLWSPFWELLTAAITRKPASASSRAMI